MSTKRMPEGPARKRSAVLASLGAATAVALAATLFVAPHSSNAQSNPPAAGASASPSPTSTRTTSDSASISITAEEFQTFNPGLIGQKKRVAERPKTCEITQRTTLNWIESPGNEYMRRLHDMFKGAIDNWDKVPSSSFGHDNTPVALREQYKAEALRDLQRRGAELLGLAETYAARQIEACDTCGLYETWGKLFYIAIRTGSGLGDVTLRASAAAGPEFRIRDASRQQMESSNVVNLANLVITTNSALADLPPASSDAGAKIATEAAAFDAERPFRYCTEFLGPTSGLPVKARCTRETGEGLQRLYVSRLITALNTSGGAADRSEKMGQLWLKQSGTSICRSATGGNAFRYVGFVSYN